MVYAIFHVFFNTFMGNPNTVNNRSIILRIPQVGWLVSGAPTFVIWHHLLIHSHDLAPLINSVLVLYQEY